jgi:hypothetical protein
MSSCPEASVAGRVWESSWDLANPTGRRGVMAGYSHCEGPDRFTRGLRRGPYHKKRHNSQPGSSRVRRPPPVRHPARQRPAQPRLCAGAARLPRRTARQERNHDCIRSTHWKLGNSTAEARGLHGARRLVFTAGAHRNPDSRNLLIPVGPQALSAPMVDHTTEEDTRELCGPTRSRPLLRPLGAAKHQRHETSN